MSVGVREGRGCGDERWGAGSGADARVSVGARGAGNRRRGREISGKADVHIEKADILPEMADVHKENADVHIIIADVHNWGGAAGLSEFRGALRRAWGLSGVLINAGDAPI